MKLRKPTCEIARRMIAYGRELGFTVSSTDKGHYKFEMPGVPAVFMSGTPGNKSTLNLTKTKLNRAARAAEEKRCKS